jgi:predicted permease
VVAEIAISLVLLFASGLLIKTFSNLLHTSPGFEPRNILSLELWMSGSHYQSETSATNFYGEVIRDIERVPGVQGAAVVLAGQPLEQGATTGIRIVGHDSRKGFGAEYREITPEYFTVLGLHLLKGRAFAVTDSQEASKVVIINAAFAKEYFHTDPLGVHLEIDKTIREVIGISADVKSYLNRPAVPTVFIPVAQSSSQIDRLLQAWFPATIVVRTTQNPLNLSHAIEKTVTDLDSSLPVGRVRSMEEILSVSIAFQRFLMLLISAFAALAVLLAVVGLYGVISYVATQRAHEIGIRMALGANRRDALNLILKRALLLSAIGVGVGAIAALNLTRFLKSLLYGVHSADFEVFVAVSLLLVFVASVASYIPARRASKVDPIVTLRDQ